MSRTTSSAVGMIIEVDANVSLTPFIEAASALVDDVCLKSGYTDNRLELIERWLAAHFYTARDPRAESEKVSVIAVKYQSKVDLGLNSSHYGQMAMRLDTKGNLALLESKSKSGAGAIKRDVFFLGGSSDV